jgi:hypothetical protein
MLRRMDRRAIIAAYRAGFAILTIVAIATQLLDIAGRGPANGGYGTVAVYCVAILVGMTAFIAVVVWVGNALGSRMQRSWVA